MVQNIGKVAFGRDTQWHDPLIMLPLVVALVSLALVFRDPQLFNVVLTLDLVLLGYHHVIATYFKVGSGGADWHRFGYLIWGILPAVMAVTFVMAQIGGAKLIATVYFYWQWYHYVRQSWGLHQRAAASGRRDSLRLAQVMFWSVPVWGIVNRSAEAPVKFLMFELWYPPIKAEIAVVVGVLAGIAISYWCYMRWRDWRCGDLNRRQFCYFVVHVFVFFFAYVSIEDISWGWLFVNIWHNFQYLMFVRSDHVRRANQVPCELSVFMRWLSQPTWIRAVYFFAGTFLTSLAIYVPLQLADSGSYLSAAGGLALLVAMVLNFHHYISDSIIWKRGPAKS